MQPVSLPPGAQWGWGGTVVGLHECHGSAVPAPSPPCSQRRMCSCGQQFARLWTLVQPLQSHGCLLQAVQALGRQAATSLQVATLGSRALGVPQGAWGEGRNWPLSCCRPGTGHMCRSSTDLAKTRPLSPLGIRGTRATAKVCATPWILTQCSGAGRTAPPGSLAGTQSLEGGVTPGTAREAQPCSQAKDCPSPGPWLRPSVWLPWLPHG